MLHSLTCKHALRALIFLARCDNTRLIAVRDIAAASGVPGQSLAKILHSLRNGGLVHSRKGPGGGYRLARPADQILLVHVIEAVDGPIAIEQVCMLGLAECSDESPCALHDWWKPFRKSYLTTIGTMTLAEASRNIDVVMAGPVMDHAGDR